MKLACVQMPFGLRHSLCQHTSGMSCVMPVLPTCHPKLSCESRRKPRTEPAQGINLVHTTISGQCAVTAAALPSLPSHTSAAAACASTPSSCSCSSGAWCRSCCNTATSCDCLSAAFARAACTWALLLAASALLPCCCCAAVLGSICLL